MKTRYIPLLIIILVSLYGCAKDGSFSKAATYEALKSFDRQNNPSIGNENNQDDMSYQEYESLRKDNIER